MTINNNNECLCLMRLRSFPFYQLFIWWFCSILFLHTDSHMNDFGNTTSKSEQSGSFGSRIVNNLRGNNTKRSYSNWHVVNKWKDHIKHVLNIDEENNSIDDYIFETFNIYNPDPMYVFLLPDNLNHTVVLRRSNFTEISFPNMTALQSIQKLLRSSKFKPLLETDHRKPKDLFTDDRHFFAKYQQFISDDGDLYEAESHKVVEENIRTERNFFKFMDRVNKDNSESDSVVIEANKDDSRTRIQHTIPKPLDYPSLIKNLHSKNKIGNYQLEIDEHRQQQQQQQQLRPQQQAKIVRPNKNKVTWEDFGLHGWTGHINLHHQNPEENGTPMHIELPAQPPKLTNIFPNMFLPILPNYDPLHLLTTTTPVSSTPIKDRPHFIHQVTFVSHNNNNPTNVNHFGTKPRPKPPSQLFYPSDNNRPTEIPVQLFYPAVASTLVPPIRGGHRRPNSLIDGFNDNWEIKFNITNELRELLKLEKNKLQAISLALNSKTKFPVTNSRSKHHDDFVFVARANNPFGHSTKWKLGNATHSNHISIDDESEDEGRKKRDVIDLYSMVKCATGCDPLIYKGYGCYCGFLGRGKALDGIDRCCKMHDYCYQVTNCPKFLEYFVPYLWKCYRGRPLCAIEHGEWGGPGSCAASLCECDKALSNCLRRFYCPRKRAVCTSSPLRLLQNILMDI